MNHTEDRLFKHLSRRERHMIYLFFVREMSWEQISKVFDDMDARGLRRQFKRILDKVRAAAESRSGFRRKSTLLDVEKAA